MDKLERLIPRLLLHALSNDEAREVADEITRLKGEVERLTEALTPSAATKAAYFGEFSFIIDEQSDEQMCEVTRKVDVPWTTIKEIMAAILARSSGKAGSDA